MEHVDEVLIEHKFHIKLKSEQIECLEHLFNHKNVFAMLPTGFGKSLIYTIFPLLQKKISGSRKTSLVVSPLRALMLDQVLRLEGHLNLKAAYFTKDTPTEMMEDIKKGCVDILFVTPEMLRTVKVEVIKDLRQQISLLVFDECHCISEWGLDFRPEYRKVSDIVSIFSDIPTLLLSATVTRSVQDDLYDLLALDGENTAVVARLPNRPNIFIHMEQQPCTQDHETKLQWLINMVKALEKLTPKTIVYVQNLRQCETLYMWMMEELETSAYVSGTVKVGNRMIEMYHSRTDERSVRRILTDFKSTQGSIRIIFATIAFGLGIDIPDISLVVHWGISTSTMTFWQELGRCSRNGAKGVSYIYPYTRSVSLCQDKKLQAIVKGTDCYRKRILSIFVLDGMKEEISTPVACDKNDCEVCECEMCRCCSNCKKKCCCKGKSCSNHISKFSTPS